MLKESAFGKTPRADSFFKAKVVANRNGNSRTIFEPDYSFSLTSSATPNT